MTESPDTPTTRPRRIDALDWSMLVLALVSIGLLAFDAWGGPTPTQSRWITDTDYCVCAIFALEFGFRWRRAHWSWRYVLRNWYDVLGMIPVASPTLRGFRLVRLLRILILLSRFGMASDRALGEEVTYRLVNRFKKAIVDAVSGAVTLAVMDEVGDVLARGTYTRNVAQALAENNAVLRGLILDKLRNNASTGRLRRVPFYDEIVDTISDAAFAVVQDVLNDPRTDALVADILKNNLKQLRGAVQRNQGPPSLGGSGRPLSLD